ncbi:MAG: hypothetical protein HY321_02755 [Armatimonadetes bacterium]|nr:hypothetical protein [Armatimonadota bacterium]
MSILARLALALALTAAISGPGAAAPDGPVKPVTPVSPAPASAGAPVAEPPQPATPGAQVPADPVVRALREEVARLTEAAAAAEAAAPDEMACVRARLELITQLLLLLIRLQEQAYLRSQAPAPPAPTVGSPRRPPVGTNPKAASVRMAAPRPPGPLFGKRGGNKLHRPGCVAGDRIAPGDRVVFAALPQALAAGYQPCRICHPER